MSGNAFTTPQNNVEVVIPAAPKRSVRRSMRQVEKTVPPKLTQKTAPPSRKSGAARKPAPTKTQDHAGDGDDDDHGGFLDDETEEHDNSEQSDEEGTEDVEYEVFDE
ncbi:hypothetical protein BV25DRAFT_1843538 [Artomyces pyxidatus]|uniref:Uncharacterized protein n=1 Tax=Artomyces pyxidatus TaxID=48021 RepID=A0ACB8SF33_9AGAM|nr:hypothetical protein BV25DRAFT_1843538 [Artomyces pyxidatus]